MRPSQFYYLFIFRICISNLISDNQEDAYKDDKMYETIREMAFSNNHKYNERYRDVKKVQPYLLTVEYYV